MSSQKSLHNKKKSSQKQMSSQRICSHFKIQRVICLCTSPKDQVLTTLYSPKDQVLTTLFEESFHFSSASNNCNLSCFFCSAFEIGDHFHSSQRDSNLYNVCFVLRSPILRIVMCLVWRCMKPPQTLISGVWKSCRTFIRKF